ncbi:hypothetical protein BDV95DRAFT_603958 [Massariosphaeria phaeospora]|uniref:FAD-binding PCMH-type domain-containing protein n=1 Tax=Massariosphaeria phaeospora TaxID=100035 RepID=A0A7C8MFA5_9PLEO|nr:hypothetical protein BDV95DRAFT_603958 [Massariosphaeria phaeospora]
MMLAQALFGLTLLSGSSFAAYIPRADPPANCKVLPGDAKWPGTKEWSRLNETLGGRLIANVPLAKECHDSNFESQTCKNLQDQWIFTPPHMQDPASPMAPYFQNNTCSPFPNVNPGKCTLGNSPAYSINVAKAEDAVAGVKFAKKHNIRLVVKNTGHDYLGRSNGQGALSLWTHNLKSIDFLDSYSNSKYTGSAVKMGAGVQGYDVLAAAEKSKKRIVAGYCPTVGVVGGYTQTSGFSALSASYGLGADQALEWEVVTTEGEHLFASPDKNADLYWALSGGGAGAYAIAISLIAKTHSDGKVAGAVLSLNHTMSDTFFNAFAFWQTQLLTLNQLPGFMSAFQTTQTTFAINFISWPGHDSSEVEKELVPFTNYLKAHNLTYNLALSDDPTFVDHFKRYEENLPYGPFSISDLITSRLIPQKVVETNVNALTNSYREILADKRFMVGGAAFNASNARVGNVPADNAVLPAWRDATVYVYSMTPFKPQTDSMETLAGLYKAIDTFVQPKLSAVTPGSGAYMNEASFSNPNWKADYFGANYEKLLEVKRKYDPEFLLYGKPNPGHEFFEVASDGRLCRVK